MTDLSESDKGVGNPSQNSSSEVRDIQGDSNLYTVVKEVGADITLYMKYTVLDSPEFPSRDIFTSMSLLLL